MPLRSNDATPDHLAVHATVIRLEAAIDNKTEPRGILLSPWRAKDVQHDCFRTLHSPLCNWFDKDRCIGDYARQEQCTGHPHLTSGVGNIRGQWDLSKLHKKGYELRSANTKDEDVSAF